MSLLFFFVSFALYLYAMPGTIPVYRDSGDLAAAIASLGIAHPPAYPFYVLLGKLHASLIPWATMAYRANAFSAIAAALTVALLYRVLLAFFHANEMSTPKLHAGVLAIVYALSPAVWALARTSEMYALAGAFAIAIVGCTCLPGRERPRTAVFLLALGLGVHPTLLFLAPLVAIVVWSRSRQDATLAAQLGVVLFLGFSVFLFLPLRGSMSPDLVWGDPSSWRGLWRLVTRADYGGLKLHPVQSEFAWTPRIVIHQLTYFFEQVRGQAGPAGVGLGVAGVLAACVSSRASRPSRGLVISFLIAGPLFFLLSNLPLSEETTPAILEPYLLLVNLLGVLLVAHAVAWLFRRGSPRLAVAALAVVLAFAKPIASARPQSSRDHFYAYDYGRNLLRSLPPRAVLYDPDDPTAFTLRALQITEHRREDVALLNFFRTRWGYEQIRRRWPDLLLPGDIASAQELEKMFWNYSLKVRPFFAELPQKVPAALETQSEGLVYRILPASTAGVRPHERSDPYRLTRSREAFEFVVQRGDFQTTDFSDFFTRHLLGYYAAAHSNLGVAYFNAREPDLARSEYYKALVIDPELAAADHNLSLLK